MALSGKLKDNQVEEKKEEKKSSVTSFQQTENRPFTEEQLWDVWPALVERYKEQVHLFNTLQTKPKLLKNNIVLVQVANSVEDDKVRSAKPEIIGYLRRTLHNSTIDVDVKINKAQNERKILTDDQKLNDMISKNPALGVFKIKFNLDFNN